jgi:hypothetical protein
MSGLLQDLQYAVRQMRKSAAVTLVLLPRPCCRRDALRE